MSIKFASVAAVLLLASGCAQNGPVKPPAEPDPTSPVAGVPWSGSSSVAMQTPAGSHAPIHSGARAGGQA